MRSDISTSSTLRWLAVAAGVVGLHAAVVQSMWDGSGEVSKFDSQPDPAPAELVQGMVLPPTPLPPPAQQAPKTPQRTAPPKAKAPAPAMASNNAITDEAAPIAVASESAESQNTDAPPVEVAAAPVTPEVTAPQPPEAKPVAQVPVNTQWQYEVSGSAKGFQYHATANMRWQLAQGRYEMHLTLGAFLVGSRSQYSQGMVDDSGLRPERFVDKARRERQLNFDWPSHTVQSPEQPAGRPLVAGTQDRLSVFMQLASLLAALPAPPQYGQTWNIPVAGFGSTEPWRFQFRGQETLDLPAGQFQTWKLERQPSQPKDQLVELWFSPEYHHLPVRIRLSQEDGDTVDQRLSSR